MHRRLVIALFVALLVAGTAFLLSGSSYRASAQDSTLAPAPVTATDLPLTKDQQMLGGRPQDIQLTKEEQQFVDLTNAERKSRGLNELTVEPLLVKVGREKSKEMHDLDYWGHESPIQEKRTAMRRLMYYLPQLPVSMTVGENLYYCSEIRVEEGEKALMNSPTHRANILKPEYQYIGIGTYTADDGRFWTTEIYLKIQY